ncbi:MAG: hypothetical protein ACRED0_12820 [Gammaproteobacteria bacterium]
MCFPTEYGGNTPGSSIPSIFPIPKVQDAFREGGSPIDEGYERRVVTFLDELKRRLQASRTDLAESPTGGQPRGLGRLRCAVFIGVAVLIGVVVGLASVGSITRAGDACPHARGQSNM